MLKFIVIFLCVFSLAAVPVVNNNAWFEPEIGIINSGVLLDTSATVSYDRRYVTLNVNLQQTQLLSLQSFNFQNGNISILPIVSVGKNGINGPVRLLPGQGIKLLSQRGITPIIID